MKIDHSGKCLRFSGNEVVTVKNKNRVVGEHGDIENHTANVASALQKVAYHRSSADVDARSIHRERGSARRGILNQGACQREAEYCLQERNLIEKRKEGLERVQNARPWQMSTKEEGC